MFKRKEIPPTVAYSTLDYRFLVIEKEILQISQTVGFLESTLLSEINHRVDTYKLPESFQSQLQDLNNKIEEVRSNLNSEKLLNEKVISEAIVAYRTDVAKFAEYVNESLSRINSKLMEIKPKGKKKKKE